MCFCVCEKIEGVNIVVFKKMCNYIFKTRHNAAVFEYRMEFKCYRKLVPDSLKCSGADQRSVISGSSAPLSKEEMIKIPEIPAGICMKNATITTIIA